MNRRTLKIAALSLALAAMGGAPNVLGDDAARSVTLRVADDAAKGKSTAAAGGAISGVLMDKACSEENKTTAKALKHGKDCAEMEDCAKSGYGVVTADGKFLTFDPAGNQQAAAFLKQHKGGAGIKIKVEGTVEGSTVKVTSIKAG